MNGDTQVLRGHARPGTTRLRDRVGAVAEHVTPPRVAGAVVLLFVLISYWWLSADARVPDYDNGKHLGIVFQYYDALRSGDLAAPFRDFKIYPPLVHLVGVAGTFVAGPSVIGAVMSQNLVFVPLLSLGCYGAASIAFDRWAGVLAVVFALATPMVISQFHVFMLDGPTASLVAVSVWLLLASRRFERLGYTLAAVATMGLGVMAKPTFVVFVIGIVAVLLVRGGWRNWRNLLIAAIVPGLIAVPWLVLHFEDLRGFVQGTFGRGEDIHWYEGRSYPTRWSEENFTWYAWSLVNNTLYLPLALFFATGVGHAIYRFARTRDRDDYVPELLVGGVVAYLFVSLFALDDPRYSLPALVYVAVLGTGWIVRTKPAVRWAAAVALVAVFVLNTFTVSVNSPAESLTLSPFPGAPSSPIAERRFVVVGPGYIEGEPVRNDKVLDLLKAAEADGVRRFEVAGSTGDFFFNRAGIGVFGRIADLHFTGVNTARPAPDDMVLLRLPVSQKSRETPCLKTFDDHAIYVTRAVKTRRGAEFKPYCPLEPGAR